ncbi:TnsA-like heteromeric transposase endonuclease subunit [Arthrobacter sp. AK04]|uniref:TnsA-like heteromeric transposase endonuclease subunit n=1 Tax=Arthrobacter sp. AK04 TaxID=2900048 RepID=UPI001E2F9117|nr:TnsA-like heteromeric transposase endonuclease subunit [Arthrobacter sp. AK04]MCD5341020.1 TnsA-like heteromeric transposase endonuclease subunit [Arthrobacter sp. AK04]
MLAGEFRVLLGRNQSDPFREFNNKTGHNVLLWRENSKRGRGVVLDRKIRDFDPSSFALSRRGYNYPHRRSYEGFYPFISSGDFVWYESLEELKCLVLLEHTEELLFITSQPFCLSFRDNTRHYPDFFALGADGRRTVYDVKPIDAVDTDTGHAFAKTSDECERQGWRHTVLHAIAGWHWTNLEWLACFRAEDMHPTQISEKFLLEYLWTPHTLAETARRLDAKRPAFAMPAIYHMMFRQALSYDHSAPLSLDTTIWTEGNHATCHRAA